MPSSTADNTLSSALGRYQIGIGGDFNSVLGLGELFYPRATADPLGSTNGFLSDYPRNRIPAAGVIVPLDIDEPSVYRFNETRDLGAGLERRRLVAEEGLEPPTRGL